MPTKRIGRRTYHVTPLFGRHAVVPISRTYAPIEWRGAAKTHPLTPNTGAFHPELDPPDYIFTGKEFTPTGPEAGKKLIENLPKYLCAGGEYVRLTREEAEEYFGRIPLFVFLDGRLHVFDEDTIDEIADWLVDISQRHIRIDGGYFPIDADEDPVTFKADRNGLVVLTADFDEGVYREKTDYLRRIPEIRRALTAFGLSARDAAETANWLFSRNRRLGVFGTGDATRHCEKFGIVVAGRRTRGYTLKPVID